MGDKRAATVGGRRLKRGPHRFDQLQRQPGDCADDQERQADEGDDPGEQGDALLNELEAIRRVEPGLGRAVRSRR